MKNARTSADTRIRFSNRELLSRIPFFVPPLIVIHSLLILGSRSSFIYIFIRLKRISLFRLLVFSFFFLWFSLKWKILIGKEKKTDRSMSGLFENFEKIYFWYVSIYAFMNICVETLKRLLLLLFLLRRYTEYVLKALEDRRKPVSEISRVMILASTYNVVVWIYYISWKRRS